MDGALAAASLARRCSDERLPQVLSYVQLLMHDTRPAVAASQIGIITPYAKQAEKLRALLRSQGVAVGGGGVLVGSTEQFQGLERRVIIISSVRSDPSFLQNDLKFNIGFLSNPKRCATRCIMLRDPRGAADLFGCEQASR
jgi:helicase MOV-10